MSKLINKLYSKAELLGWSELSPLLFCESFIELIKKNTSWKKNNYIILKNN